jgi:hypothetical protein
MSNLTLIMLTAGQLTSPGSTLDDEKFDETIRNRIRLGTEFAGVSTYCQQSLLAESG